MPISQHLATLSIRHRRGRIGSRIGLLFCLGLALAACSSPTEVAREHYEQGLLLFKQGGPNDLVAADAEFRNALLIKKTLAPAIFGLALVAERQGKLREMYSYLEQTLGQDPGHFEAQIKLGRLLLGVGQIERAAEASAKALALQPEDPAAQILDALILLKRGDAEAAVGRANALLAKHPGFVDAIELLASERLLAGDAEAALRHADAGLKDQTNNAPLLAIRMQALEKLGRIDEAEKVIRQLIAAYPENPAYPGSLIRFMVSHNRKDAAEAELRGIAAKQPANAQLKLDVVRFVHAMKGAEAARQELEAMVARQPDANELKFALAAMLQAMNDRPAAQALIQAIAEKNGDTPDGLKARAQIAAYRLEAGDKAGALKLAEQVLAKDNRNEHALQLKAAVAIDERRFDQAIGDLRALLRDNPDSPRTLVLLGKAHEMQGTASLAEEQFARAYQVSKQEPVYGITYAEFLLRQNQAPRAEKLLTELIRSRPNLIPALKLLAEARSNLGNWAGVQQAKEDIRRLGG